MTVANPPIVVLPHYRTEFDRLCQLEPRLSALLDRARTLYEQANLTTGPHLDKFADREWYGAATGGRGGLKQPMCKLVGWGAPEDADPTLKTSEAYDVAYAILYNQLCGFAPPDPSLPR